MTEEIEDRLAEIVEQLERIADAMEKGNYREALERLGRVAPLITLDDYS